ncbi:MAG: glycoside hydrolase family 9 protein [Treponema sp.]|nr:glycoside hydrolase family 9 protein [Treponema sp.]
MSKIFVNQVGYLPDADKVAVVEVLNEKAASFVVKNNKGAVVFEGTLSDVRQDELAGGKYALVDFSALSEEGRYTIEYDGNESYGFDIKAGVYKDLYRTSLEYFTLSRCGEAVKDPVWGHEACHTGPADIYGTDRKKTADGGWHDAGDYGRYIVAGAKTVMDLLYSYETEKGLYGNTMKFWHEELSILDEVRFELEWFLRMQREDGAVYHKASCYRFCGFIWPDKEKDPLVLAPVSTTATADFAGACAYAAKFYKDSDPDFADRLIKAAKLSQEYLDSHEDELYKNPPEITTGGYGDGCAKDERYFALCALFGATGDAEYLKKAVQMRKELQQNPWWGDGFGWGCFTGFGNECLLRLDQKLLESLDAESRKIADGLIEEIKEAVIATADKALEIADSNVFAYPLPKIFWGSNGAVMDAGHCLTMAYDLTGDEEYFHCFQRQLSYILGVNPVDYCYVTGFGSNPMKNPHHRPSGFLKKPMPGMLSGGPGAGLNDAIAKEKLQGAAPLKCFIDHQGSYSTNEIAIYWNSPLTLGLSRML